MRRHSAARFLLRYAHGRDMAAEGEHAADLPFVLSSFVGRAGEIAEIRSLLDTARLFTLTGSGGSGKTRLAAQVAGQTRSAFRQGVRWVDLSTLSDPALIADAIAAQCAVADRGGAETLDALVSTFRPQHLLLILDNCEHLLPASAQIAETLLASCPDLHILATSRESLAIPGEVVWLVPPLRVPPQDTFCSAEEALAYEAIELFMARAIAVLPGFRLTEDNVASVVRICRQVDGLPLALELAAARLRALSPTELAERLDDASAVLTRGSRTAHPRQQTLRATLDWSYDLLPTRERTVFQRLAVFAGSFSLGAIEAVCAGAEIAEAEVLDALTRLIEKSLVTVQEHRDETRYRLLEPLRQYARDRLEATGTARIVHERHRDRYATLAARAAVELGREQQGRWLDRLADEHDNLRAALGWSLADGDAAAAGEIATGIWQFWLLRGHLQEGRRWLERILAALTEPTPLRAHLLWIAGILARPDAVRGDQRFKQSLAIWQRLGDRDGTARLLGSLGFLTQARGDHVQAVTYLEQSLPLLRSSSDVSALARVLISLALSILETGDVERATDLCTEGLALHRQAGDLRGEAAAQANLGLIWQAHGDEQRAAALWAQSLAIRRQIGDHGGTAHVLSLLGSLAVTQRAFTRAAELYQESLAVRRQMGDWGDVAPIFEGLAAIGAAQNDLLRAARLAGAADALRTATGVPPSSREHTAHAHTLATLRMRLSAADFAQAWAAGQALPLEQAIALATAPEGDSAPALDAVDTLPPSEIAPPAGRAYDLTPREVEVLRELTLGLTYAQIAETLVISPRTVDAHIRAIFSKLAVRSRTAATRVALQERLV